MNNETICAPATNSGGAISIIRVSGPEAIQYVDTIFQPKNGKRLTDRKGGSLTFGDIRHGEELVDEALVSVFRAPHSYTGEDSAEISCHGSAYIVQRILTLLMERGCRMAAPGEFTQRAYLNGKMDLSQAEAVADLIASNNAAAHRLAMNQMKGGFSKALSQLRDKMVHLASLMELELDFSDHEELEFADRTELMQITDDTVDFLSRITSSFKSGNAIKNGIPVAIIGETNAGKSTLLNALIGDERAIVSDIPGTTRDTIEDTATINGVQFRFIDTAGIRETNDPIEKIGIERAFSKVEKAEIILWVIDATHQTEQFEKIYPLLSPYLQNDQHLFLLLNKQDLQPDNTLINASALNRTCPCKHTSLIPLSAHSPQDITLLIQKLSDIASHYLASLQTYTITNSRHYEALNTSLDALLRVQSSLRTNLPTDLICQDLREALHHLSDLTGEISSTTLLHNIFQKFCIGK